MQPVAMDRSSETVGGSVTSSEVWASAQGSSSELDPFRRKFVESRS